MAALLRSRLPIAIYPCGTKAGAFAKGRHNTYWQLPDVRFVERMDPGLRRYLAFAWARAQRTDFLRALEDDAPAEFKAGQLARPHHVWETAVWLNVANRRLVRRLDGHCRIVRAEEVGPADQVLPNELRPCHIEVKETGEFTFELTEEPTHFWIYDRGDPQQNETALREALPAWYTAIRP